MVLRCTPRCVRCTPLSSCSASEGWKPLTATSCFEYVNEDNLQAIIARSFCLVSRDDLSADELLRLEEDLRIERCHPGTFERKMSVLLQQQEDYEAQQCALEMAGRQGSRAPVDVDVDFMYNHVLNACIRGHLL